MRILDQVSDKSLSRVTLYLTKEEAAELRDGLEELLARPKSNHVLIRTDK